VVHSTVLDTTVDHSVLQIRIIVNPVQQNIIKIFVFADNLVVVRERFSLSKLNYFEFI